MLTPSLVRTLVQRDTQSSNHPQILASHLLGLQGPQQTPASRTSWKRKYLNVSCCALTPCGLNLNHYLGPVCVHSTYVPMFDLILWEIRQGYHQPQLAQDLEGLL